MKTANPICSKCRPRCHPAIIAVFVGLLFSSPHSLGENEDIHKLFHTHPQSVKPSGYWWWPYNNVDKASITRNLQEFSDKGIGAVLLVCSGSWGAGPTPSGPEFLSEGWKDLFLHALDEAERYGTWVARG